MSTKRRKKRRYHIEDYFIDMVRDMQYGETLRVAKAEALKKLREDRRAVIRALRVQHLAPIERDMLHALERQLGFADQQLAALRTKRQIKIVWRCFAKRRVIA